MTKTYELSNEIMRMVDVDEEHHMATVSIYVLDNLVKEANKANALDKIREEIEQNAYPIVHGVNNHEKGMSLYGILQIIDKYIKE